MEGGDRCRDEMQCRHFRHIGNIAVLEKAGNKSRGGWN